MLNNEFSKIALELGAYIVKAREKEEISAYKLAQEAGTSRTNISKLENGKIESLPKPATLRKIAEILKINIIELYIISGYLTENEIDEYIENKETV